MEKARICLLDENDKEIKDKTIEVMFNPTDYSTSLNVEWGEGNQNGMIFSRSNYGNLDLKLFFDTYEKGTDVREAGIKKIAELGLPSVEGEERKKPPVCLFQWGKFKFKGVIEKVDQSFTMFLSDGTPVRANVNVTMKPVVDEKDILKLSGIEACRKLRVVKQGDRLDTIAAEELKDPLKWRLIADANNITDPLNFPGPEDTGKVIIIPD